MASVSSFVRLAGEALESRGEILHAAFRLAREARGAGFGEGAGLWRGEVVVLAVVWRDGGGGGLHFGGGSETNAQQLVVLLF